MPSTTQPAAVRIAHSLTAVSYMLPTTVLGIAQTKEILLNKPKPWTPI